MNNEFFPATSVDLGYWWYSYKDRGCYRVRMLVNCSLKIPRTLDNVEERFEE